MSECRCICKKEVRMIFSCDGPYGRFICIYRKENVCLNSPCPNKRVLNSITYCKWVHFIAKRLTRFAGCGIESMQPIFKTAILIDHSKAYLDLKILETYHSAPWFTCLSNLSSIFVTDYCVPKFLFFSQLRFKAQ